MFVERVSKARLEGAIYCPPYSLAAHRHNCIVVLTLLVFFLILVLILFENLSLWGMLLPSRPFHGLVGLTRCHRWVGLTTAAVVWATRCHFRPR